MLNFFNRLFGRTEIVHVIPRTVAAFSRSRSEDAIGAHPFLSHAWRNITAQVLSEEGLRGNIRFSFNERDHVRRDVSASSPSRRGF
jgi:hypothetical protein